MHLRLLAVGDRQPKWVDDAFAVYQQRLPREWRFRLDVVATTRRSKNASAERARDDEGRRLLDRLGRDELLILLDERGRSLSSGKLGRRLTDWLAAGSDLAFVIGGPDGVSTAVRDRAAFTWSLSELTLPHGLARVLLIEQLYRAYTLSTGHPYHRQ